MILKLLWNTQMIWMILTKTLKNTTSVKKCKILIVFDVMIAHMLSNKKFNPIVTDLFIRDKKLIISLVFVMQSYFVIRKDIKLNSSQYFIMKIQNKWEHQQIAFNHSSDIDFKDFVNLYKNVLQDHILF